MPAPVMAQETLKRAIRQDMADTWRMDVEREQSRLQGVMQMGIPSDNLQELWGYDEPAPMPSDTPWGEEPDSKTYRYKTFTTENRRQTSAVKYNRMHRELGNLGDLKSDAQYAGKRFATYPVRVFFQQVTGTVDDRLLPSTGLLAPDGVGAFSTVDGAGADRFGVTDGNIVSGLTVSTGTGFRSAVMGGIIPRFLSFLDPTEGEPIHEAGEVERGILIVYPISIYEAAAEAFNLQTQPFAASSATSNASISNIFQDSGINIQLWGTPRLTVATEIYCFLQGYRIPFMFEHQAMALQEYFFDHTNSPAHAKKGEEEMIFEKWSGFGQNLPVMGIKGTA